MLIIWGGNNNIMEKEKSQVFWKKKIVKQEVMVCVKLNSLSALLAQDV